MIMLKWLFPEPTPDEVLITELKEAVARVTRLGAEAKSRGITVWLKTGRWRGSNLFLADHLCWDVAYKTNTEKLG